MNFCPFNSTKLQLVFWQSLAEKRKQICDLKSSWESFIWNPALFCSLFLFILIRCFERDQGYVKALFYPLCLYPYWIVLRDQHLLLLRKLCAGFALCSSGGPNVKIGAFLLLFTCELESWLFPCFRLSLFCFLPFLVYWCRGWRFDGITSKLFDLLTEWVSSLSKFIQ